MPVPGICGGLCGHFPGHREALEEVFGAGVWKMSQVIADLYELKTQIGAGGGGVVYLGRHIRLEKDIVLKADKRSLAASTETLRREVDMLKGLSQTYIPQVYDFVQEDGVVYTVMDYIPGESINKLLDRGEKLPQVQVIKWACQLLEALEYLHGRPPHGILHGDIKPANIMLQPDGNVCLIDFNIALALGEDGAVKVGFSHGYASPEHYGADYVSARRMAWQKTRMGENKKKSTLRWGSTRSPEGIRESTGVERIPTSTDMEPKKLPVDTGSEATETMPAVSGEEQTETVSVVPGDMETETMPAGSGSSSHAGDTGSMKNAVLLDVRSDIYSLGATLYHMLSGRRPAGDAGSVEPLTHQDCSPAVAAIIARAMSPVPENRYQTAAQMREAFLSLWVTDGRVKRHRRHMIASATVISLLFLAGGGCAFVGMKQMEQRQAALAMAEYSHNALDQGNVSLAVSQAMQAIPTGNSIWEAPVTAQAQKALSDALGVYDLKDGFKSVGTLELPGAPFDLVLSPEGTRLAVVYGYETAVYDLDSLSKITVLPVQPSALSDCLFTDENHVVYADPQGITLYDLEAQEVVWTGEAATTLSVSGDGSTVAAVDRDGGYAMVYNVADGSERARCSFHGQHMAVAANDVFADPKNAVFTLNEDGSLLAVSFSQGGLTVFDMQNSANDIILYEKSKFHYFQGGFCGKYFAYTAFGDTACFGLVDTVEAIYIGTMESREPFSLQADKRGIYLGSGNVLAEVDPGSLTEREVAYTGILGMSNFVADRTYALVATEDNCFSFYNAGAYLMGKESGNQNADFLALSGEYAVVGNRTEKLLRILHLESHADAQLASYDARCDHQEARVSGNGKTVMLFGYQAFWIYDRNGKLLAEEELPDADHIYDQQFRKEGEDSWLEVIWYDGTRRFYSATDGTVLFEERGQAPDKDLYEEFVVGEYRIASGLHEAPIVYDLDSGRKLAVLEAEGYLTYVTELEGNLITEYIDTEGKRYGVLLNKKFEPIAYLPGLCDVTEDMLVFDDGAGNLRGSHLYSLKELVSLGEAYLMKKERD